MLKKKKKKKKSQFSDTVQYVNTELRFCLKCCVLALVSLSPTLRNTKSALIGPLTHVWASTADNNRAAVLNEILHAKQAVSQPFIHLSHG